ncbi:hypothetical protein [Sphingomonas morindae]|uniref:MotA/TolQ/ExbB proton channel domain-containing protein n=1 Tax=Sphingomonas morindae TaxID=1541170 RepID=A0ABY4XCF9_9SPHN|nr:hypothetical protein [Sphingomonas morindae]USI74642.1 hypothetical protein LHA26_02680 [Sphingomonas morindae]
MAVEGDDPAVFVLRRELSEVHLLLDNISANPDAHLPPSQEKAPGGLPDDWLTRICEIDWPPENASSKAEEASLLIRAKDFLNTLARPASGATIAFTLLVTQSQQQHAVEADVHSRNELASKAYPDLIGKAERFRAWIGRLTFALALWLLATVGLAWQIAYANAGISQALAAQAAYQTAAATVEQSQLPPAPGTAKDAAPAAPGAAAPTVAAPPAPVVPLRPAALLCQTAVAQLDQPIAAAPAPRPAGAAPRKVALRHGAAPAPAATPSPAAAAPPPFSSLAQLQACNALNQAARARDAALGMLQGWWGWLRGDPVPDDVLAKASAWVAVWGNGVLPVCFGLLGAAAAIVRRLSDKMKINCLAPRDLNLLLQQLALGAVTGACIGLFAVQPSGDGSNATALAALGTPSSGLAFSASALAFIAGFGVETVFVALDGIIKRIFNVAGGAPAPAAPAATR